MSIEIRHELHRKAQPSNRTSPEVIRDMTIEHVSRLARIVAAPNKLPLPARCHAPAARAPPSTRAHSHHAVAIRGGRATAQAIWMTPAVSPMPTANRQARS